MESVLKKSIAELDIRVPVLHIKNNQYLFGHQKVQAELKDNKVMLRVKGEAMSMEEYKEKLEGGARESIAKICQANKITLEQFAQRAASGDEGLKELQSADT